MKGNDRRTGQAHNKDTRTSGENKTEARQNRELRDVQAAINKGYRNQATEGFFKR